MGINITQFAPPGKVSTLVWDGDMTPGAGKKYVGDVAGDVTGDVTGNVTGNVTGDVTGVLHGNTSKVWTASAGVTSFDYAVGIFFTQIYQLPPGNTLSGVIKCNSISGNGISTIYFIGATMECISTQQTNFTPTEYTIPTGTNGIYVRNTATYGSFILYPMIVS